MKFTPRKNAFTTGILGILVSVFFLSPISMSLTRSAVERGSDVPVEIGLSYRVSEVYAQNMPSDGTNNVPDGSTNNTSYQNFPYANDDNTSISNTSNGSFQNTQNPFGPNTSDTSAYPINGNYTSVNDPNYAPSIDSNISNGPIGSDPNAPLYDPVKQAAADQATQGSPGEQAKAETKNPPENGKTEQNKVIQFIGNIILGIGAFFAMLAGTLLDAALKHLVFEMGVMVNQNSFGSSITQMWTLLRDICNLLFIFGFIYLGIRTIIDPESATVKRTLARIIIGALLINFSLFIVKFVVDVSNFTALKIYQAMTDGTGSVTGAIMQIMGVSSFYSADMKPVDFTNITTAGGFWFYVMGALMFIVIAVTFAIAAVMLVVRFAVLIFLMLGAPLLFAAPVFPKLESIASDLWKKLFSNAFFAPVYLLLVLISVKLTQGLIISMKGGELSSQLGAPPTSVDAYSMVLNFIVIIFFLIQSLTIAKKMGAVGGEMATSAGKKMIGGATVGLAAATMRSTVGRYAHSDARIERLKEQSSQSGFRGWSARQELKMNRKLASSSFDARNVGGGVGAALGMGAGGKGGYAEKLKETQKKEEEFARSLGYDKKKEGDLIKERDVNNTTAKANVDRVRTDIDNATATQRQELINQSRIAREAEKRGDADEAKRANESVLAKKAEIEMIVKSFEAPLKIAEETAKAVEKAGQMAIDDNKKARQTAYGETLKNTFYRSQYTNEQVSAHVKEKAGTEPDKLDGLLNEIKNLKDAQGKQTKP